MSCVENQVLAILREQRNDIRPLYHNSAIPLRELMDRMLIQGEKPYRFYRVPRIQDELKAMGRIEIALHKEANTDAVREHIRRCGNGKEGRYVLVRVTPEFTKTVLHARGFREDHYVRAVPAGRDFLLYNDIPDTAVSLGEAAFGDSFTGEFLSLSLHGSLGDREKAQLWDNRLFRPEQPGSFPAGTGTLMIERLRDLLGVCKTMRYRMRAYYGQYVDTDFIGELLSVVERDYAKAEYWNLRKSAPEQAPAALLEELWRQDARMMEQLTERLEEKQ